MNEPRNLVELFLSQVQAHGGAAALRFKKEGRWRSMSWTDWAQEVKCLARGLIKLGMQPRDAIALVANNRPEWVHFDLATLMAGGILVSIYPTLTAGEVNFIMQDAKARFAVVENAAQLAKLQPASVVPLVEKIILIDGQSDDPRVIPYAAFKQSGEGGGDRLLESRYQDVGPHEVATYIYTSGTTGRPKGAMITHDNILFITDSVLKVFEIRTDDSVISYLPLSHVYERVGGFYTALRAAIPVAFAESIEKMTANLVEVKPTILCAVPRVLEKAYGAIQDKISSGPALARSMFNWALKIGYKTSPYRLAHKPLPYALGLQHNLAKKLVYDKIADRFGGKLRFIAVAGAPMSKKIAEFFDALNIVVLEGYGMTECAAPATLNTLRKARFGTVGLPLPGVQLKIAEDGEILLGGRSVFVGYFGMPEATAETLVNGWLHTGDIGEIDPDGMVRITDRKKDLIVTSGGKNIAPQKIENLMIADQYIAQVMVIGDKRNYLTALIAPAFDAVRQYAQDHGFSVPDRAAAARLPQVMELLKGRVELINKQLAKFETIKDFRLLENDLALETGELTPTLKVKRKVVLEKYKPLIEQMYADKTGTE